MTDQVKILRVSERENSMHSRLTLWFGFTAVVWFMVMFLVTQAGAQEPYETMKVNVNFDLNNPPPGLDLTTRQGKSEWSKLRSARNKTIGATRSKVRDVMAGKVGVNEAKVQFDGWFNAVVLPEMTLTTPDALDKLASRRKSLFDTYLRNAKSPAATLYLSQNVLLPTMSKVAIGNYHPACRVNAIVMIGRLNKSEGKRNETPPIPLIDGLNFLLTLLEDKTQPAYIHSAVMYGVMRHAEIDGQFRNSQIPAASRQKLIARMLELVKVDPSNELEYFTQRQAIRVLGSIKEAGAGGEVAAALLAKITEANASIWIKCDAVNAYSQLKFATAPSEDDVKQIVGQVAELTLRAARDEVASLTDASEHIVALAAREKVTVNAVPGPLGSGGGDPYGGDEFGADEDEGAGDEDEDPYGGGEGFGDEGGGEFGDPNAIPKYRLDLSRRRLKTVVYYMMNALGNVADPAESTPASGLTRFDWDDTSASMIEQLKISLNNFNLAAEAGLEDEFGIEVEALLKDEITKYADGLENYLAKRGGGAAAPASADAKEDEVDIFGGS